VKVSDVDDLWSIDRRYATGLKRHLIRAGLGRHEIAVYRVDDGDSGERRIIAPRDLPSALARPSASRVGYHGSILLMTQPPRPSPTVFEVVQKLEAV
jgi:hypothetical protein